MKAVRVLLVGIGVLAVVLVVALIVALNSSFQTWAARRQLSSQPDLKGTVGNVSAGFQHVAVRDLQIETHGVLLKLPSLEAELPVVTAALNKRVHVQRVIAKGWTLDLSHATNLAALTEIPLGGEDQAPAPVPSGFSFISSANAAVPAPGQAKAAARVFRGLFADLRLPVDLSLDGVELEGDLILPVTAGQAGGKAKVALRGGGLAAGKNGAFTLAVSGTKDDGGALALQAKLTAAMDTPRTFTRFGAKADAMVSGPKLPDGVRLNIDATADRTPRGETYSVLLAGAEKQLAVLQAELAAARITGTWKLDLKDSDVEPFVWGKKMPTFTALGEGGFETGTALQEIHATGQLKASAEHLEIVRKELAAIGPMNLVADFDVLQHGESLRVEKFNGSVSNASPVASLKALQPFEFNLSTAELRVADPEQDLVSLSLTGLPLAWARPLLGDIVITGSVVRGEFAASAREGGLALRSKSPVTVNGVDLSRAGKLVLTGVDLTLNAAADYTPQGWQAQIVEFGIRKQGTTLLVLDAKAGQLAGKDQAIKATGRWSANLPAWVSQPVVAGKLQLASGSAQGEFTASADGTTSIETKLALDNLTALTKEKLPAVVANVRADITANHHTAFKVPMVFTQEGRKSDLLLSGEITPGTPISTIDARLSSDVVIVEDLKLLGLLLPGGGGNTSPAPGAPEAPPAWSGLQGQIGLALKKVVYGGTYVVSDVVGTVKLDPSSIKFEGVHAMFGTESDVKLTGGVTYDAKSKEAYALNADVALNNFDTGAAFRAVNPAKLPTLEGRVNVSGHIAGDGANLNEAAEKARGRFDVSSKGGIFRALATVLPSDKLQSAQSTLAIVGGFLGGPTAETINAANEIVKIVSEIQFDQLSVKAERGADLNLLLQDFTLISPNIRLGGTGQVTYAPDTSLLQQALDLRITMGARGRLGELLTKTKMLKAEKDSLGYTAFSTPIQIGGTLAQTDTSDLKAKLLNAALEKTGVSEAIDRLLGREKSQ